MDCTQEKILTELEQTASEFWNISHQTAVFISMLIKASNTKEVLEIGTSNGYSAIWIAEALKTTGGHLTTIEFWDNRRNMAIENFKGCGVEHLITPLLGSALEILPTLDKPLDMVFIDANKSEYIKYFNCVHPLLKKGGIILADNVLSHKEKVAPFVDAITAHSEYESQVLELPAGLLMAYKL